MNGAPLAPSGHDAALATLRTMRAQTLLFVGPEGVGRRLAARWYAARLNCRAAGERPCGRCDSCARFAAGTHPDYREVAPNTTTSSGRLNRRPEIRIGQLVPRQGEDELPLGRWLEQRPAFVRRVGVIDGADALTGGAANAFLKFLEEPPSYAVIVLIAPGPQAVLPTIASRSVVVRFGTAATDGERRDGAFAFHPGHRLGRPGALQAARLEPEAFESAWAAVDAFVGALPKGLEEALEAADALEKAWSNERTLDVAELLRERLRSLPAAVYARGDDLLARAEEALAAYASAPLTVQVLTLELRAALKRAGVRDTRP